MDTVIMAHSSVSYQRSFFISKQQHEKLWAALSHPHTKQSHVMWCPLLPTSCTSTFKMCMIYSLPVAITIHGCLEVHTAGTIQELGDNMSSILVFISSKAFNSPPRETTAAADPPLLLKPGSKMVDTQILTTLRSSWILGWVWLRHVVAHCLPGTSIIQCMPVRWDYVIFSMWPTSARCRRGFARKVEISRVEKDLSRVGLFAGFSWSSSNLLPS